MLPGLAAMRETSDGRSSVNMQAPPQASPYPRYVRSSAPQAWTERWTRKRRIDCGGARRSHDGTPRAPQDPDVSHGYLVRVTLRHQR